MEQSRCFYLPRWVPPKPCYGTHACQLPEITGQAIRFCQNCLLHQLAPALHWCYLTVQPTDNYQGGTGGGKNTEAFEGSGPHHHPDQHKKAKLTGSLAKTPSSQGLPRKRTQQENERCNHQFWGFICVNIQRRNGEIRLASCEQFCSRPGPQYNLFCSSVVTFAKGLDTEQHEQLLLPLLVVLALAVVALAVVAVIIYYYKSIQTDIAT